MTKFINLFGGPGIGKSTTAAGVFYKLKSLGYNVELVPEFAKDLVWESRLETLQNQFYVTARQFHMISKLADKADIVVTDSPILLGSIYAPKDYPQCYHETIKFFFDTIQTPGLNFMLSRHKAFVQSGRVHTYDESTALDAKIARLAENNGVHLRYIGIESVSEIISIFENSHAND